MQARTRSPTPIVHRRSRGCPIGLGARSHRAPGFSFSGGCAAKPRASHPSGSRPWAGRRWRAGPGPWHVSRAPENLRCHVASNWLDHRSRGSRWRRVQPLVAHDMGAALETPRRLGPMAVLDGVQSDLMVLSQPQFTWLAVATWPLVKYSGVFQECSPACLAGRDNSVRFGRESERRRLVFSVRRYHRLGRQAPYLGRARRNTNRDVSLR